MNYLVYLKKPHFLALFCGLVSAIVTYCESKYSKVKNDYKYYLKIFILVTINVYVVLMLVKKGIVPLDNVSTSKSMKGGGLSEISTPEISSINTSNYQTVDIGNPNF